MPQKELKPPKLVDDRLVAALSHETRAHALTACTERPTSSKEIAAELGLSVSGVWYHVHKLRDLGCIELVESKKRRGATEHFYRATVRHFFDAETWAKLPEQKRETIAVGILQMIAADVDTAVRAKYVDTGENHLSRTLLILDPEGWAETTELLAETLEGLLCIREKCVMRRAETDGAPIRASVSIMQFELPLRPAS